jgi:hypothetical protein
MEAQASMLTRADQQRPVKPLSTAEWRNTMIANNRLFLNDLDVCVAPAGSSESVIGLPVVVAIVIRIGAIVFSINPPY